MNAAMNALNRHFCLPQTDDLRVRPRSWIENREDAQAEVLRILAAAEKRAGTVNRGQPKKTSKSWVVWDAVWHLLGKLDPKRLSNKHIEFIELFYETVTSETNVRGTLDWQIRQAMEPEREPKKRRGV